MTNFNTVCRCDIACLLRSTVVWISSLIWVTICNPSINTRLFEIYVESKNNLFLWYTGCSQRVFDQFYNHISCTLTTSQPYPTPPIWKEFKTPFWVQDIIKSDSGYHQGTIDTFQCGMNLGVCITLLQTWVWLGSRNHTARYSLLTAT